MSADANLGRIFTDSSAYADPKAWHEQAARLRREHPILKVAVEGFPEFWAITKHADVKEIERHPEVFTNAPLPVLVPASLVQAQDAGIKTLIAMDGEQHRAHRHIVDDFFKPASVKRLADRIDELAARYVDRMAEMGGECDFAGDVAVHYPLSVILSVLGLPEADHARMLTLTQELFGAEDPDLGRQGDQMDVIMDFVAYFTELTANRRAQPTDDLASVVANAELDGGFLGDLELFGHYVIIATAGHDTTSSSIAGGLLALIEHPDQLALLQREPELIDRAADEFIRYVTPVKHFNRTCQAPFTLRDVTFQPGDLLLLSFDSANRDDEVFPDPDRLDVTRPNAADHVAFGYGRHFCLGAHLARLEIRAIFRELLGRLDSIELAGDPTFVHARFVSGPKTLPVRYSLR